MAKNDRPGRESRERNFDRTRMRSPFTAETPDEFGEARWIPEVQHLPDESAADDWPIPSGNLDPLGFIPGTRK